METLVDFTQSLKQSLHKVSAWAKYAAYISFINLGLSFLQIIVGIIKGNLNIAWTLFSFLISALISLVMTISLFKFSTLSKSSVDVSNMNRLNQSMKHLKIYFSVMGILFVIIIALLLLFILIAAIAGIIASTKK